MLLFGLVAPNLCFVSFGYLFLFVALIFVMIGIQNEVIDLGLMEVELPNSLFKLFVDFCFL